MTWNVVVAFVLDQIFGYQSANKFRENLIVLASRRSGRSLGGSRTMPQDPAFDPDIGFLGKHVSLGPNDALDFIDIEIDGTNQGGITYQARVEVRIAGNAAGMTITPKIRNVTDGVDAGVGTACSASAGDFSGTNQKQTIALTIATGVKKYRLQYTLSSISCQTQLTGEIESFATA